MVPDILLETREHELMTQNYQSQFKNTEHYGLALL